MLTKREEYEERDDDLTYRKIRRMKAKSKRMNRLKEKGTLADERHKKLMEEGIKNVNKHRICYKSGDKTVFIEELLKSNNIYI